MRELSPGSAGVSPASTLGGDKWHSRGYLPHFEQPGSVQMITFRLADALPTAALPSPSQGSGRQQDAHRRQQIEDYLDAGHGGCHLRDARVARLVETALLYFDGVRYRLIAWVVMPNHVHVVIETNCGHALADVVQSWKSFTAKEANRLLRQSGRFWQPEYFDRAIRDDRHLVGAVRYIHENPVKAALAASAQEWPFCSAARTGGQALAGETRVMHIIVARSRIGAGRREHALSARSAGLPISPVPTPQKLICITRETPALPGSALAGETPALPGEA